ncbi:hypothetical protein GIB67_029571 [Kingdonia uniflora]|uniref:DYW domain-containing protein n=1 Tax=Kingdonia uniflora TaxID=39325 RepID=A0A7J7LLH1_9MAGN|nr:hypothetical protein GIB67_029571 [Kingdonia uniflora]
MISGFTKNYFYVKAFEVFREMVMSGTVPNVVTITSILPAFANLGLVRIGRSTHGFFIRQGLEVNVLAETALVDMYAKFGLMKTALKQFDVMPQRNIVSWNAVISGYSKNGFGEKSILLFKMMQIEGYIPDDITIMSLIEACLSIGCLQIGSVVHSYVLTKGLESDLRVQTALMEMYINYGCAHNTYQIFNDEIPVKDVVTWTLMLSGFSDLGYGNKAMGILNELMGLKGVLEFDYVALVGMLSSCSKSGALQQGKHVHAVSIKVGFEINMFVGSALIDMYANCGSLESAKKVFEGLQEQDIVCWNAMISGNGINGHGDDAIELFLRMKGSSIEPNDSTFVCILSACSHAGLVDQGLSILNLMGKDWNIVPKLRHCACIVDLLGRAGRLDDACSLINNMPFQPDEGIYGSLLAACRVHNNIKLGLEVSKKLFELGPNDAGYYVLLSNMFANFGDWEAVKLTRVSLRSMGLKKLTGLSSIEIDGGVHTFMSSDMYHPQRSEINETLMSLIEKIEAAGYVPNTKYVFQDVLDDVKRDILFHHSEKLAIAFGIIRTQPGTTIRIVKNLRICDDCHTASKFISKVVCRELIIKDAKRFHHFKDGACSCKDYW